MNARTVQCLCCLTWVTDGVHHDRDVNAAKNILDRGLKKLENEKADKPNKKITKKRNNKVA